MNDLQPLVDQADVPALLRAVDGLCAARDWDRLSDLARRCLDAVDLGKQLWAVATHIDYRIALEGPPRHAARVLRPGAGRFALGPLPEVAATTHPWEALEPFLDEPVTRLGFAQERVLHGEDLTSAGIDYLGEATVPLRLQPWEPSYPTARYRDRSAEFPQHEAAVRHVPGRSIIGEPRRAQDEDEACAALRGVVETWATESSGDVRVVVVDGTATDAVAHLRSDRPGPAGLLRLEPPEALAVLQWAGASGGAHGRRPGGASGRFAAWWAATALAGLDWPADGPLGSEFVDELAAGIAELEWFRWAGPEPDAGWTLRMAVTDPVDGLAWAIEAVDHRDEPDS